MRAESSWSRLSVAGETVGRGYEDSSSCTDHVGLRGIPVESTSAKLVLYRSHVDLDVLKGVLSLDSGRRGSLYMRVRGESRETRWPNQTFRNGNAPVEVASVHHHHHHLRQKPALGRVFPSPARRNHLVHASPILTMAAAVQSALRKLLPSQLPPSLSPLPGNLFEVLSRFPQDGVGQKVHQTRWGTKGVEGSYWEITRTRLKCEGKHGKAWGVLVWKGEFTAVDTYALPSLTHVCVGKRVSERDEKIPGSLKYRWAVGESRVGPGFKPLPNPLTPPS